MLLQTGTRTYMCGSLNRPQSWAQTWRYNFFPLLAITCDCCPIVTLASLKSLMTASVHHFLGRPLHLARNMLVLIIAFTILPSSIFSICPSHWRRCTFIIKLVMFGLACSELNSWLPTSPLPFIIYLLVLLPSQIFLSILFSHTSSFSELLVFNTHGSAYMSHLDGELSYIFLI